jgi:hypothetical protein
VRRCSRFFGCGLDLNSDIEQNIWHVREQQVGGAEIMARAVKAMVCVSFPANSLNRSERSTGRWRGMWDCAMGNHCRAFDFGIFSFVLLFFFKRKVATRRFSAEALTPSASLMVRVFTTHRVKNDFCGFSVRTLFYAANLGSMSELRLDKSMFPPYLFLRALAPVRDLRTGSFPFNFFLSRTAEGTGPMTP